MLLLTYVFIILIKFAPKKLRAVKVAQLDFLSENLKEILPPQFPGRKYVRESSLGIVAREVAITNLFNSISPPHAGFSAPLTKKERRSVID